MGRYTPERTSESMTKDQRHGVTVLATAAAVLLGSNWGDRIGLFCLIMVFVVTIDMTGDEKK